MPGEPRRANHEPLWDRVDRNRATLAVAIVFFTLASGLTLSLCLGTTVTVFMVWSALRGFGDIEGTLRVVPDVFTTLAVGGTLLSAVWSVVTLFRSPRWMLDRFGAAVSPKGADLPTKFALKDMALAAGFEVAPALHVVESRNVNAFLLAPSHRRATVGVTRGFVDRLTPDEQRAAFANLMARLRSGDVLVDTGLTALLWPLNAWRDMRRGAEHSGLSEGLARSGASSGSGDAGGLVLMVLFGVAFSIIAEIVAWGHRKSQLARAEVADAEGMLLLKDPQAMVDALEKCIRFDNVVPGAGPAFGQLFYCWPGDSSDDEDDPEWARVSHLREVIGVEGMVPKPAPEPVPEGSLPPLAPRVEHAD